MFLIHACTFESKKKKKLRVKYIGVLFDELSYYPDYPQGEDEEWSSKKNKLKKPCPLFNFHKEFSFSLGRTTHASTSQLCLPFFFQMRSNCQFSMERKEDSPAKIGQHSERQENRAQKASSPLNLGSNTSQSWKSFK